jgi:membrane protein implicated in regulation of membrane protease activity
MGFELSWTWFWVILSAFLVVGEIFTAGFFILPFGIGAAVAALVAWLGFDLVWQWATFLIVSIPALLLLKRFADRVTPDAALRVAGDRVLDAATDKWGTRVVRVEIQRIDPPNDVTEAMHRQMKAERERRAMILEAEGDKQSAIERATGNRQSQILMAQGEAEAIQTVANAHKYEKIAIAEGEAQAIASVYGAIHAGDPTNDLIAIKYLETLGAIADGKASKIYLPLEVSGVLGSIGGISELFRPDDGDGTEGDAEKPAPGDNPDDTPPTPRKMRIDY